MSPPVFKCLQCNAQFWGIWSMQELRCQYCGATYKIPRREFTWADQSANREQNRNHKFTGKNANKAKYSIGSSMHNSIRSTMSRPNKRAFLCGVTYQKRKYKLKGTVNDVRNIENLLMSHFEYPKDCIRILTEPVKADKDRNEDRRPTKKNILDSLKWLVEDCQPGDSLFFYFSGHGLQQKDENGDEVDGYDETICPIDFLKEGMIVDDDINETIVRPLVRGVKLHAIVDACHSGTILDLAYVYNREKKKWEDNIITSGPQKNSSGGRAICLSACEDNKFAADSTVFERIKMNGVMTYLLADIAGKSPGISYGDLMDKISERIIELNTQDKCLSSQLLSKIFCHKKLSQNIQLSSSEKFDVYSTQFSL